MAEFITWVESSNRAEPYILTDGDIFIYSSLKNSFFDSFKRVNDILSGETIIKFFKLNPNICRVRTVTDFWNIKKLPTKIADMVKKFDNYWSLCFQNGFFSSRQLLNIIEEVPENSSEWKSWKTKAWNQLVRQKVTVWQLATFLEYNFFRSHNKNITTEWKERISEKILELTRQEISTYVSFFNNGMYRDKKQKPPKRVEMWGLEIIQMIFSDGHHLRGRALKIKNDFQNNMSYIGRIIKRR